MKRILSMVLSGILCLGILTGCSSNDATTANPSSDDQSSVTPAYEDGVSVRVAALSGPTAMGLVSLMDENEGNEDHYQFSIYTTADEISPLIGKNEIDIALVPTNLAATLYQKTEGGVQILDVNAGNVLYVISHDETLNSLDGLKGRTLYMTGKGTTPEWTLRYLLQKAGIGENDLTISFKTEAAEVLSALSQDAQAVGVLPQPFATVAMMQDQELSVNFALDDAWKTYSENGSGIATGVTIVRTAFAEEHPQAVAQFIVDHQKSVETVTADPALGGQLIEQYGIVKAAVAEQVLTNFNPIVCTSGEEMKTWVSDYLSMLYEIAPDAVGGKLPDEGFYYLA